MIVVVGSPRGRSNEGRVIAAGFGVEVAIAIAAAEPGQPVQLVGRIGEDPVADAVLADLSQQGVGHVAILRDAAHPTPLEDSSGDGRAQGADGLPLDAEDLSLALRYLIDVAVIVVTAEMPPAVLAVIAEAAGWAGATVIAAGPGIAASADAAAPAVITIDPTRDEGGAAYAARLAAVAVREATLRSAR